MFRILSSVNVPLETFGLVARIENMIVVRLVLKSARAGIIRLGYSENFLNSTVRIMERMIPTEQVLI